MAFSVTGMITTSVLLFAPTHANSFQLTFWARAPHWSCQIASFCWMGTLGLYIVSKGRTAFDVAIAHAVIWMVALLYWVVDLYAMYYDKRDLIEITTMLWKVFAIISFLVVCVCWGIFARRRRQNPQVRRGSYVISKLVSYTIAFLVFVSPIVIVELVEGMDSRSLLQQSTLILLALWPTANALIYLTRPTWCLRIFGSQYAADDLSSNRNRNVNKKPTANPDSHLHELKGLEIGEKIGEGIAVVYKGKWRGADVAVKMKALLLDSHDLEEFQNACNLEIQEEAAVMKVLCHPNIVLFMEAGFYKGSICIISEYCARGSLRDVLSTSRAKQIGWPIKVRLALGIAHGLQYLHNANPPMIHRDLKSPNVLVDDSWHAKIADFGTLRFAEIVSSLRNTRALRMMDSMVMTGLVGTTRWMAPEVIRGEKIYSSKVDIYSLGLILWELIDGKLPFSDIRWNHEIENFVLRGMRPMVRSEKCPLRWKLLVVTCWQADPMQRPTIQQVIHSLQRVAREEICDKNGPWNPGGTRSMRSISSNSSSSSLSSSYESTSSSVLQQETMKPFQNKRPKPPQDASYYLQTPPSSVDSSESGYLAISI